MGREDDEKVGRKEVEEAIAKTVELRAIHASLMQGNTFNININNNGSSSSPISYPSTHFSAQDYPVFTPSYEEEPLPASAHMRMASQSIPENWDENSNRRENHHICPIDDIKSVVSSSKSNYIPFLQDDWKSASSCNKCKPAIIVPLTDESQHKSRRVLLSWLFPKSKRRQKAESEVLNDMGLGIVSIETLKKELIEANHRTNAASMEVSEMKSSFVELKSKLEFLESHCEELKKTLLSFSKKETDKFPDTEQVPVEGLLQIVGESRQFMKHFCKTLFRQIQEKNSNSKSGFYHLTSVINQTFYEDFENCAFQKNGTPKLLDPQQERQQKFQSFVALKNLSWNEVLKKGTKYYSEEFSNFCDQKMKCIIATLKWTKPWPESLLQTFFIAAKCVWLLHLLAFSLNPQAMILRVEENRLFDTYYMEDVLKDEQKIEEGVTRIKVMVMPGFYVYDRILKCKVLCRYKSTT